jgi:hypothetical protein
MRFLLGNESVDESQDEHNERDNGYGQRAERDQEREHDGLEDGHSESPKTPSMMVYATKPTMNANKR